MKAAPPKDASSGSQSDSETWAPPTLPLNLLCALGEVMSPLWASASPLIHALQWRLITGMRDPFQFQNSTGPCIFSPTPHPNSVTVPQKEVGYFMGQRSPGFIIEECQKGNLGHRAIILDNYLNAKINHILLKAHPGHKNSPQRPRVSGSKCGSPALSPLVSAIRAAGGRCLNSWGPILGSTILWFMRKTHTVHDDVIKEPQHWPHATGRP